MKPSSFTCAVGLLLAGAHVQGGDDRRLLLEAEFNDQPLDQPIGTGGAVLGQPISVPPELSAIVRAAPRPTPSLEISHAVSGFARSARFEFLDGEEVSHGDLIVRLTVRAAQLDYFIVTLRERTTNTQAFLRLAFTDQGNISVNDGNGFAGNLASYSANVDHRLRIEYHMDRGTYDIELDGLPILSERSHGITGRGIGALLVGTDSVTDAGSLFQVDNIRIVRGDGVFADGFDG